MTRNHRDTALTYGALGLLAGVLATFASCAHPEYTTPPAQHTERISHS